jgi:ATP-dependent Clp protease ATP-binding subunit ClpA
MDASNLLKPALSRAALRCIGSTTYKEYRQFFEKDRALVRRFQKIDVAEPTVPDAIKILKGLKPYFEDYHKVATPTMRSRRRWNLSARYITDRKLPDKAIDVIDETGASQMLLPEKSRKKNHHDVEIENTIAKMARIRQDRVQGRRRGALAQSRQGSQASVVYGQDRPSMRCRRRSSWPAPACASPTSRSAPTCSPAQPASARPKSPSSWHPAGRRAAALRHVGIHGAAHGLAG